MLPKFYPLLSLIDFQLFCFGTIGDAQPYASICNLHLNYFVFGTIGDAQMSHVSQFAFIKS